jgi:sulfur-oxidizing protein SoxX
MNKQQVLRHLAYASTTLAAIVGCASMPGSAEVDALTTQTLKTSFRDQGPVHIDRLVQDETNRICSEAQAEGRNLTAQETKTILDANMKTVQWPSDGKFFGDWKQGEAIAQNGRGLTWTDDPNAANGGNCYNCHQLSKEEVSYGTIGPSLYNYGKLRGVMDPTSASAKPVVEYTWGKIWNAKAYNACSLMPRVGASHILNETQVRHVMALLLDPQSPVNK